jgi:chromosome partitioning protein
VQKAFNPSLKMEGALITMVDSRASLSQQVVEEVRKMFGNKVYRTVIPRNVRLAEAPSHGLPITLYDKHSTGAEAYMALSLEIMEKIRS